MGSHRHSDRRQFLTESAALAGLAVGAVQPMDAQSAAPGSVQPAEARLKENLAYGQRSRFDNTARRATGAGTPITDTALMTPLQDLDGIITPSGLHFLMDHVNGIPDIDPQQHRLLMHGMVDRPLNFTMEEIKRLPSVSRVYFLECNANSRPLRGPNGDSVQLVHGRTSCSEWTGVLLSVLLKECGVKRGASWIVAEGSDSNKYTMSIPLVKAMDDILVAYAQNGEPVRPHNGLPAATRGPRLGSDPLREVVEPHQGGRSTRHGVARGRQQRRHETRRQRVVVQIRAGTQIDHHSTFRRPTSARPGFCEITGLAWTGGGAVRRVDVSIDGGRTYKEAELQQPVLRYAHTRFRFAWKWNGEEAVLQSRCTDEQGEVQPTIAEAAKNLGVTPEYFYQADHFNGIQPWKVNRDGSIQNAMF